MFGASRLNSVTRQVSPFRAPLLNKLGLPSYVQSKLPTEYVRSTTLRSPCAKSPTFLTFTNNRASAIHRTISSVSKAPRNEFSAKIRSSTQVGRLKDLWHKYGVVAIGTYMTLYGAVLGSIYLAIDQGWLRTHKSNDCDEERQSDDSFNLVTTTNKFVKLAEEMGIAQYLEVERVNSKTGTFLLAWVATKFTEPVRLGLTIAMTPRIARFLGRDKYERATFGETCSILTYPFATDAALKD
ncbi:Predicted membrane protein [Plasmopara halstedii]|uniref:Predicted membrane protein n=1 Tax=Plasmopara halstedii TaxID=4781 RepID=A0A0P1ASP8_PLAHL|nr:Predicted membrane protein [Plasmopara halstedii]CEG44421.1 Predicted membrane protein [Plasmopara halstedii]|eukprot:XP_024580790.1 Predicted membrane protein [Plasmopara halstedii]